MKNLKSKPKNAIIKLYRETEAIIKRKCYDCMCGQKILDFQIVDCMLYDIRPWINKNNKKD